MSPGAGVVPTLLRPRGSTVSEDFMLKSSGVNCPAGTVSAGNSPVADDHEPPIDLVHLARQCQGDADLEAELLWPVPAACWRRGRAIVRSGYGARAEGGYRPQVPRLGAGDRRGTGRPRRPGDRGAGASGGEPRSGGTDAASLASGTLQAAVAEAIDQIDSLRRQFLPPGLALSKAASHGRMISQRTKAAPFPPGDACSMKAPAPASARFEA